MNVLRHKNKQNDWLIDWSIDRLIDWLIDWLIDLLIDWSIIPPFLVDYNVRDRAGERVAAHEGAQQHAVGAEGEQGPGGGARVQTDLVTDGLAQLLIPFLVNG